MASVPSEPRLASQDLVLINPPDHVYLVGAIWAVHRLENLPMPRHLRALSSGGELEATRVGPKSLRVRYPGGFFPTRSGEADPLQPAVEPDAVLTRQLIDVLAMKGGVVSVSLDVLHPPAHQVHPAAEVADMQTAALFATAAEFEVAVAALLIVSQAKDRRQISDEMLEATAKRAGIAAAAVL